jgi:hypothetical protein
MSKANTIQDEFESVYKKPEAKKLIIKIGSRRLRIFISDFIIIIASIITFISGFFPPFLYIGFAFSAGLIMTLIIRLNIMKTTAMLLIILCYVVMFFTSYYISAQEIFLFLIGINQIGKIITYTGAAIILVIYMIGIINGIKGFKDKYLIFSALIILGISIGSGLIELVGNLYIYQVINPLVLTSNFILQITGFFISCSIAFAFSFLIIHGIKTAWIKNID